MLGMDEASNMFLLKAKTRNNKTKFSSPDVIMDFSGEDDEVELDQMPWVSNAIRKAVPNERNGRPVILASSHVHKHKPKNGSGGPSRRDSDSSILGESDTNTLWFAPDAARAGKAGLSLVAQEEKIRKDAKTGQLYTHSRGSETIRLRTSKPFTDALLGVPDAPETFRMAATRRRNFGAPQPSKK